MALLTVTAEKPRQIAVRVLKRYGVESDYLESVADAELGRAALSPADRRLAMELIFGVTRWQETLDWLIDRKTDKRPQKPEVRILLRLGLYQLFWLERIPEHAAVHETVADAKHLGFVNQAGFINALLRNYVREREETQVRLTELKTTQPAVGYSQPQWLCNRWKGRWGHEKLLQLLDWNNTPPATYARLNTLKTDADKLTAQWKEEGVEFVPRQWDWVGNGLVFELQGHPPLADLPSLEQGLFYVQDPSTLLAVVVLDPQPGQMVLDTCAAPGGKTTLMAQLMRNQGQIVAQDVHTVRRDLVRENCLRLGVTNVHLTHPSVSEPGQAGYDRILIDAPCSNTGVMRRRVDVRWRLQPEEIERLRQTQLELLHRAAAQLKPRGTLVYSTCSLEPEENEEVTREFVSRHPGFAIDYERNLLPFVEGVDGAYVARLRSEDGSKITRRAGD